MRIAFISDIHGNANALDAVLKDIQNRQVERVYVLGDIAYRGPEPQRSVDLVRSLDTFVIKGNADEWVVRGVEQGEVPDHVLEMMRLERDWIYSQMDQESIQYLNDLPTELKLEAEGVHIHAYHATPDNLFDIVLPHESEELIRTKMMVKDADLYVYAHIHRPFIRYINGKCIINLGSVGLPFDGLPKASYALIDIHEGSFQTSIVRVDYDIQKTIQQFEESDYPNKEKLIQVLKTAKQP